jgi:DNA-binding MarR family transcriptional regulator
VDKLETNLHKLDIVDLISERHIQLRSIIEKVWNDSSDIYISNSEWFIMARIYKNKPTISNVSKNVDISRQATHKFIKSLESKGLVVISSLENNKKDKCIQLTELGEECYEKNQAIKAELVEKIIGQLGTEKFHLLNDILKLDWGL